MNRIGPRMQQVYEYVLRHPGCTKYAVSRAVGPHGSIFYGWRAVQRAIEANMITADWRDNRWSLLPVARGGE